RTAPTRYRIAASPRSEAVRAHQIATAVGPIRVAAGEHAASSADPATNSTTGTHHDRRRSPAPRGPQLQARQNQRAPQKSNETRESSSLPRLVLSPPPPAIKKYASVWRCRTVRHPACDSVGRIQADKVIAPDRSSDDDGGTRTRSPASWKLSAPPKRP